MNNSFVLSKTCKQQKYPFVLVSLTNLSFRRCDWNANSVYSRNVIVNIRDCRRLVTSLPYNITKYQYFRYVLCIILVSRYSLFTLGGFYTTCTLVCLIIHASAHAGRFYNHMFKGIHLNIRFKYNNNIIIKLIQSNRLRTMANYFYSFPH